MSITREIYEGFQRGEFARWDKVIAQDVELYSPGAWGVKGLEGLKTWATEFLKALKPRIDLVDEFEGGERAFLTVNLNWKHVEPFFALKPTGREGTSIETFILTIKDGKVVRFGVADNTLDLSIYLWEQSAIRQQWLERAVRLALAPPQLQVITGLETWFTLSTQGAIVPPPRYKMMILSGGAIFPITTSINLFLGSLLSQLHPIWRS